MCLALVDFTKVKKEIVEKIRETDKTNYRREIYFSCYLLHCGK